MPGRGAVPGTQGELRGGRREHDTGPATRRSMVLGRGWEVMGTCLPQRSRCPSEPDPPRATRGWGADPHPAGGPGVWCAPVPGEGTDTRPLLPSPAVGGPGGRPAPARRDGGDPPRRPLTSLTLTGGQKQQQQQRRGPVQRLHGGGRCPAAPPLHGERGRPAARRALPLAAAPARRPAPHCIPPPGAASSRRRCPPLRGRGKRRRWGGVWGGGVEGS